jgi:hypothetical protein
LAPTSKRWLGLLLVILVGCGGQATVSGKVLYDGQAVADGWISFIPAQGGGMTAGAPVKDGQYSVTGLAPGKMRVTVTASPHIEFPKTTPSPNTPLPKPVGILITPEAVGNGRITEFHSGTQTLDIDLRRPTRPQPGSAP